jgi:hypothetical protein
VPVVVVRWKWNTTKKKKSSRPGKKHKKKVDYDSRHRARRRVGGRATKMRKKLGTRFPAVRALSLPLRPIPDLLARGPIWLCSRRISVLAPWISPLIRALFSLMGRVSLPRRRPGGDTDCLVFSASARASCVQVVLVCLASEFTCFSLC